MVVPSFASSMNRALLAGTLLILLGTPKTREFIIASMMPSGANPLNALEVVQYTTSNDLASSSCMSSCFSLYLCLPIFHPPLSPLGVDLAIHKSRVHKLFPHSRYRAMSYDGQHASAQQIQRGDSECTGAAEYFFHAGFDDIVAAAISCMANDPQSLAGA